MQNRVRTISFVLPVYNEATNVEPFHLALLEATASLVNRYALEFVFVNDGSHDDSLQRLRDLHESDHRVRVLSLSRNFGHQMAVTAGLDRAQGDAVVVMDTDLQDPPRIVLDLVRRWEDGADVVYAQRRSRQDTFFKRTSADLYYRLLAHLTAIEIPRNTGDFRLMDRRVVDELCRHREHNRYIRGLVASIGFRQEAVLFDRDARLSGRSGYPLKKMIKFATDGIVGFSSVPLQLISRLGFVMAGLATLGLLYVVGLKLFSPASTVPGWAFVTAAMFFLGGIQLLMLGVLGTYVGRIYTEVQNRPLYALDVDLQLRGGALATPGAVEHSLEAA